MLKRLRDFLGNSRTLDSDSDLEAGAAFLPREKALVFGLSFILAFCLWFIVNLSRDFNITVSLPLNISNIPEDMALVTSPPDHASVGVTGEGWMLISLYNNPPSIMVYADDQEEVNLFERVQRQVATVADVSITQVDPFVLNLNMEEKIYKEVPVEAFVEITTDDRHGLIGEAVIEPQTVTISGAASRIDDIERVRTKRVVLEEVKDGRELELEIESPFPGISVYPDNISYQFEVTELTEGEVRIPIRIRNLPPGQNVTYHPSTVTVRYDVPIEQYNVAQESQPFRAYIDYNTIVEDTTGMVIPQIERLDDRFNVTLRSYQPRSVSYFNVVN